MCRIFATLALSLAISLLGIPALAAAQSQPQSEPTDFEVWTVDQADAADGGDRLYVFRPGSATPAEVVPLAERAAGVGEGAGVRPHLLLFNNAHTHAVLANVASGHVYVIRAADRRIVASIDVGLQAHGAMASPDDRWILVANQNGKRLARIQADFASERFEYQPAADLDLGALEDPAHPDNAPICPVMYVGSSGKAYVTVRGGGMYVVDTLATPMRVVRDYTRDQIAPAGCGGLAVGNRVYVNSGSATSGNLYVLDAATDEILASVPTTTWGTDPHGMVYVGDRYLWIANRGDGDNVLVFDTMNHQVVGTINDVGAAPDLMDLSPNGQSVYVTLRGPSALTGGPSATGQTPGLAILSVENGGATGRRAVFVPIGDQSPASKVDPHGIAVRWGASYRDELAVRQSTLRVADAIVSQDRAALGSLYPGDFDGFLPSGLSPLDRSQWLAGIEPLLSTVRVTHFSHSNLRVRLAGDAAVAVGNVHLRVQAPDGSSQEITGRATEVYQRRGSSWTIVHAHVSLPPAVRSTPPSPIPSTVPPEGEATEEPATE
jgi:DNA-binding beta-propeller fold protein YncE/ketosteroid isomerase-like protein